MVNRYHIDSASVAIKIEMAETDACETWGSCDKTGLKKKKKTENAAQKTDWDSWGIFELWDLQQ